MTSLCNQIKSILSSMVSKTLISLPISSNSPLFLLHSLIYLFTQDPHLLSFSLVNMPSIISSSLPTRSSSSSLLSLRPQLYSLEKPFLNLQLKEHPLPQSYPLSHYPSSYDSVPGNTDLFPSLLSVYSHEQMSVTTLKILLTTVSSAD